MATLTSKVQALLTYANGISGKEDTTLGDAVKSLGDLCGGDVDWMTEVVNKYKVPLANVQKAYEALPQVKFAFLDGYSCWLVANNGTCIKSNYNILDTDVFYTKCIFFEEYKTNRNSSSIIIFTDWSSNSVFIARTNNTRGLLLTIYNNTTSTYENNNGGDTTLNTPQEITILVKEKKLYVNNFKEVQANAYSFNGKMLQILKSDERLGCEIMSFTESDGTAKLLLVPSKHNGKYCMIDLVSGDFYENQGTGDYDLVVERAKK